jgi:hypothetical protein
MNIQWEPMDVMQRKFPPHPVSGIEVYRDEAEVLEAEFSALGTPRKTKCDYASGNLRARGPEAHSIIPPAGFGNR